MIKRKKDRLKWWRKARFGMFIHWGIYALPAGIWKGKNVPGIGEWIMFRERIPVGEYEKLALKFNPLKFNAKEWVGLAKSAGMKYIVITAKHHDGFAMFKSASSKYNIVDATPYGKDPMKELAAACKDAGLRLCFYYSQDQDWHHPGGSCNTWDYPNRTDSDFARYLRRKVKPQLRELLTQYGPIGLIWFDTPKTITRNQSRDLKRFVHRLQPDCLVSGRVGHDLGDYGSLGDNQIPSGRLEGDWETPATMNDTWGFKKGDHNWKSVKTLLELLIDLAGKGINYLLNVGPTAEGLIPLPSVNRLRKIGSWLKGNGEAIFETQPGPFPYDFEWGRITRKPGKLFLLFTKWPNRRFALLGLKTEISEAYTLKNRKMPLKVSQSFEEISQIPILELRLPAKKPDPYVSVVVLEFKGKLEVDNTPLQQPNEKIRLPASLAAFHCVKRGTPIRLGRSGAFENWVNKANWVSWDFKVRQENRFKVRIHTTAVEKPRCWSGGHEVSVSCGKEQLSGSIVAHEFLKSPRSQYFPEAATNLGVLKIEQPGVHALKLRVESFPKEKPQGLSLLEILLIPV